jgi:NADPH:quinone reductase-like Zn-dependent oxidoreductase
LGTAARASRGGEHDPGDPGDPGDGQVLVEVRAVGVSVWDVKSYGVDFSGDLTLEAAKAADRPTECEQRTEVLTPGHAA